MYRPFKVGTETVDTMVRLTDEEDDEESISLFSLFTDGTVLLPAEEEGKEEEKDDEFFHTVPVAIASGKFVSNVIYALLVYIGSTIGKRVSRTILPMVTDD